MESIKYEWSRPVVIWSALSLFLFVQSHAFTWMSPFSMCESSHATATGPDPAPAIPTLPEQYSMKVSDMSSSLASLMLKCSCAWQPRKFLQCGELFYMATLCIDSESPGSTVSCQDQQWVARVNSYHLLTNKQGLPKSCSHPNKLLHRCEAPVLILHTLLIPELGEGKVIFATCFA